MMTDESERIWMEAIVTYSRYPGIFPEGLRNHEKPQQGELASRPRCKQSTFGIISGVLPLLTGSVHSDRFRILSATLLLRISFCLRNLIILYEEGN
jgi:hypothetical protein